ncbi:hypothetical protein NX021_21880 [Cytobacillus firmus]|nr:hypothetical protein [Cytobacillus firmus]
MGRLKSLLRQTIGYNAFLKAAIIQKKLKPKKMTKKPIAFMFGISEWKHSYIKAYLSKYEVIFIKDNENINYIINEAEKFKNKVFMVWGYKDRPRVRKYAQKNRIPYYRIEDGFIRSVELGASKSTPISLCIDSKALYYDATKSSDLEDLLNEYDFNSDKDLMARAVNCMEMLRELNISKYNNVDLKNIDLVYGKKLKKRILVIGQVEDDESIKRGCSKPMTNNDLVWLAKMENPDAEIIYKPHPDVLFGKRAMQSNPNDVRHIAKVITEPLSLTDAFETIDHVYTITSLSGFEALLRGIKVTTLGAPFYSGWGLTDDRQTTGRRNRKLSVEEIFAAAYILYPRYMHPITKEFITIEEAIKTIKNMKDLYSGASMTTSSRQAVLFGFNKDGHEYIKLYLTEFEGLEEVSTSEELRKLLEKNQNITLFISNSDQYKDILEIANENDIPVNKVNFGFITASSSSDFIPVSLWTETEKENNYTDILNDPEFKVDTELSKRAGKAINFLIEENLSQINLVPEKEGQQWLGEKGTKRILVLGSPENKTKNVRKQLSNKDLIWIARVEHPDAEIIYVPHPLDLIRRGEQNFYTYSDLKHLARIVEEPINIGSVLNCTDIVYTIDSDIGFEALFRKIPVITFGNPYYAGWGLTEDRGILTERKRTLTLNEIFAGIYILNRHYFNPFTREKISLERSLELLKFIKETENKRTIFRNQNNQGNYPERDNAAHQTFEIKSPDVISQLSTPIEKGSKIGILSKGIKVIPNLKSFLKGELIFNPSERVGEIDYVAGWGMKPSAKKAIEFCKKHNIPYLGLEDGFLRSLGLGVDGSPPLSVCLDDVGIYYDATRPSRLENILNSSGWETEQLLNDAEKALALIKKNYLSKYNHAPMLEGNIFVNNGKKRVLIVDQTLGDMSISLGLADKERFKQMYEKAKKDNPDADIFIKTHPDVISGKKEGNLTHKDVGESVRFLYNDCNPLSLLEQVDKVYVVTSQFGFEALMLGKEVHCFGMPFYAGWGVTRDEQKVERRNKQRSVTEIFAAAYLLYPCYIHPETGMPGTIFDVINYLAVHRPQVIK